VHLKVEENRIRVLLGSTDDNVKVVLEYEDDLPVDGGKFGFLSYKQKVAFTNIQTGPIDDYIIS